MYFVKINESWYLHYLWSLDLSKSFSNDCVNIHLFLIFFQKQPPELFFEKRCSQKFCKIHRKTPVPESFCEFWEISKSTFFTEHLWSTAFKYFFKRFCLVGKCEVILHCLYRDPLTLILWTYPFFISIFLSHEKVNRI